MKIKPTNKAHNLTEPVNPTEPHSQSEVIDVSLIEFNLTLTPEQRLENHQRALELFNEIVSARKELYGESEPSSETST